MSKQLILNYDGKEYTLEFTRKTVEQMERNGFIASDANTKPMTVIPTLFAGAFAANHKMIKKELTDKIYDSLGNKIELLGKLVEMYNEPITALFDDPEGNEGNENWVTSW